MGKPWFGAKAYGIGIAPKSVEGWIATLVYVVAVLGATAIGRRLNAEPWMIGLAGLILTIALLALSVIKGDHQSWRWRWGGKD
ncbi:hypothetical protein [Caulobacter sp. 1776]|uniref:hypothetical protein n=1 Tax=Caulobacter sp. 1776 TaxID=3156420 RepID=UPI003395F3CA